MRRSFEAGAQSGAALKRVNTVCILECPLVWIHTYPKYRGNLGILKLWDRPAGRSQGLLPTFPQAKGNAPGMRLPLALLTNQPYFVNIWIFCVSLSWQLYWSYSVDSRIGSFINMIQFYLCITALWVRIIQGIFIIIWKWWHQILEPISGPSIYS